MVLNNADVMQVLREKGVAQLFHANSVLTACTFLEHGHLLSRARVQSRGLRQTPQSSDEIDKKFGIFDDIFLDGIDIHARARTKKAPNEYGPVLFVFRMDSVFADRALQATLRITRTNPIYWTNEQAEKDRYYSTAQEFASEYRYGDFQKMLTFRVPDGQLTLAPSLQQIVIDDPGMPLGESRALDVAQAALTTAAGRGGINVKVDRRTCSADCICGRRYAANWLRLRTMFEV